MATLAALNELDLFTQTAVQCSVDKEYVSEHRPIMSISNSTSPITFHIQTTDDEYINLREMKLRMRVSFQINKEGAASAADWAKIATENLLLHSMFKSIEVELNDKLITDSQNTYPYKAMFEVMTNFTNDAKNSHLSAAGYSTPSANKEDILPARSSWLLPKDPTSKTSKVIELYGKLFIDMAYQPRAILGGSSLRITFLPQSSNAFYLRNKLASSTLSTNIVDICLEVNRSKVTHLLREAHLSALNRSPARYNHTRSEVRVFNLSSEILSETLDNIIIGTLPRRALVGFVSHEAFNGSYATNPFNFQHFNLSHLCFHMDGQQFPSRPFTPDFEEGLFMREYLSVFDAYNQLSTDSVTDFHRDSYLKGKVLYGVNLSPDTSDGALISGHISPAKRGNLRLEIKFAKKLTAPVNVLLYLEYDAMLEISKDKTVRTNYI